MFQELKVFLDLCQVTTNKFFLIQKNGLDYWTGLSATWKIWKNVEIPILGRKAKKSGNSASFSKVREGLGRFIVSQVGDKHPEQIFNRTFCFMSRLV